MPLSSLTPLVTARFQEVSNLLTEIAAIESPFPQVPDTDHVRALRGLFYVHLYGAFEYAMDQSFIRLALHINQQGVKRKHVMPPVFSVALDEQLTALQAIREPDKKFRKRIETMACARDANPVAIRDSILSGSFQSATVAVIQMAFDVYGISEPVFYDITKLGYLTEVVERRHAVAHGRQSPVEVGVRRTLELRLRYNALYSQAIYVMDTIDQFLNGKKYVLPRHRRSYRSG